MRLVRLPLLLAVLLAPAFAASIAHAQANDQKVSTAQTPGRAGQVKADDIIDDHLFNYEWLGIGEPEGRVVAREISDLRDAYEIETLNRWILL